MALVTYCDVCHEIIPNKQKKYILGVNAVLQDDKLNLSDYNEVYEELERKAQNNICGKIQLKEICEGCKKVLEHFFALRQDELTKTKKEIEKMLKNKTEKDANEK